MSTSTLLALAALAAPAPQDPAIGEASLVLEALDGATEVIAASGLELADPRARGAVFARYAGVAEPAPAGAADERATVSLHGGGPAASADRLVGWIAGGDEEHLDLAPADDVRLRLSIEEIASIVVPGRLPDDGSASPQAPDEGDRLYVRRGRGVDQLDGVLLAFAPEGVSFEGRLGERTHPWAEVAALFVEDLGAEPAPPADVPVTVELAGGGRLRGGLVTLDAGGLTLARGPGEMRLPAALVREVAVDDGSYRFLSDVPVTDGGPRTLFGGDDDLGMVYPHRVDRSCVDGPLLAGGRAWARGLGVHAPSRLTWRLEGGWSRLRASAAIDDSALANRHPGSVVFRVHGDGEVLWESPLVRGGDPPQLVDVDLAGVDELVLEVDPASEAFVSDRANWLRPILVRAE